MNTLDRRQLLATAAYSSCLVMLSQSIAIAGIDRPPLAPVRPVTDRLWGDDIIDPYRWMENQTDPEWLGWAKAQDIYVRQILESLHRRKDFLTRIGQLSGDTAQVVNAKSAAGILFFERRLAGADDYLLIAQHRDGRETILADPAQFEKNGESASIDWWQPSPDGRYVVLGMSLGGNEAAIGRVVQVSSGHMLSDELRDVPYTTPAWLPDGSGFFYNRFAGRPLSDANYYNDRTAWLHRVGTNQSEDVKVAGAGVSSAVAMTAISSPELQTGIGSDHVALLVREGYVRGFALYLTERDALLSGKPAWRKICGPNNGIIDLALSGNDLFLVATKDSPRGSLLRLKAASGSLADATLVLPEGNAVIDELNAGIGGTFATLNDGGEQRLAFQPANGAVRSIDLPFTGWVQAVAVDARSGDALVRMSGWLYPPVIFQVTPQGIARDSGLQPKPALNLDRFNVRRIEAVAKDGTKVPVTVIARTGKPTAAPCLVHVYGAYQWPSQPVFDVRSLAWLEAGGSIATAHVRGGGEYGSAWHEAGMKATKPNTWRDLIACCEALIGANYTARKRIAIVGGSAGGIAVTRAMEERSDLFGAVVSLNGMANTLRAEFEPNGQPNVPEFGTVKEEAGYRALRAMDGYHGVVMGQTYPPMLLTTGLNDARVAPYNAAKLAARVQSANPKNIALLRLDMQAGHVTNALARDKADAEAADTYAFAWNFVAA